MQNHNYQKLNKCHYTAELGLTLHHYLFNLSIDPTELLNKNSENCYLLNMLGISKHANFHLGSRDVRQFHRATETLILLWIVVLKANLEFNSLHKFTVLLLGISHDSGYGLSHSITRKLTAQSINTLTFNPFLFSLEKKCLTKKLSREKQIPHLR